MESSSTASKSTSSKPSASSAPKAGDAEAPGPITPSHESGSWEQTAKVDEAREALLDAQKTTAKS
jgi:hypothetical protein